MNTLRIFDSFFTPLYIEVFCCVNNFAGEIPKLAKPHKARSGQNTMVVVVSKIAMAVGTWSAGDNGWILRVHWNNSRNGAWWELHCRTGG